MAAIIHANVLGLIEIEALVPALVDYLAMQRLRRMEQRGVALFVGGAREPRGVFSSPPTVESELAPLPQCRSLFNGTRVGRATGGKRPLPRISRSGVPTRTRWQSRTMAALSMSDPSR